MRIIAVDDHPLVRSGLISVLMLGQDNEIVGEASNVSEAEELIESVKPDLAFIDLRLGNESGLDIVKRIKSKGNLCRFIVLTSSTCQGDFKEAEQLGVEGYVLKEALPDELLYALRVVSKGRKYYDPGLVDLMVNDMGEGIVDKLTPREVDVLTALGKGLKNCEIAGKLFITEYTVKKHISQIFDKLGFTDRTQAALYANNRGLVKYR